MRWNGTVEHSPPPRRGLNPVLRNEVDSSALSREHQVVFPPWFPTLDAPGGLNARAHHGLLRSHSIVPDQDSKAHPVQRLHVYLHLVKPLMLVHLPLATFLSQTVGDFLSKHDVVPRYGPPVLVGCGYPVACAFPAAMFALIAAWKIFVTG